MQTNICMDIQITTDDTCPPLQGMQEPRKHERFLGFEMPPTSSPRPARGGWGQGGAKYPGPGVLRGARNHGKMFVSFIIALCLS